MSNGWRIVVYGLALLAFLLAASGAKVGKATAATFVAMGLALLALVPFVDAVDAA